MPVHIRTAHSGVLDLYQKSEQIAAPEAFPLIKQTTTHMFVQTEYACSSWHEGAAAILVPTRGLARLDPYDGR